MQFGQPSRQPVPNPEPLTLDFNERPAIAPMLGEEPLLPFPFMFDSTPQAPQETRKGIQVQMTPATPGTPRTVAINPLDFPLG
jgi:hypothetical protein